MSVSKLRHKAELPLLIACITLTFLTVVSAIVSLTFFGSDLPDWVYSAISAAIVPFFAFFYDMKYKYWKTITNGVEITEKQFGEVYQMYLVIAKNMGFGKGKGRMAKIPRLYMGDGGKGKFFTSKYQLFKSYVVIAPDILYLAYKMDDFNGVRFILAHELGHIKCGHQSFWRALVKPVAAVFFINWSLNRAQEWTADRCAYYYAPEGKKSLLTLYAGKTLYAQVNFDEYIKSAYNHKYGFWFKLTSFLSSYPVGFRRMEAIKETETKGWNVHGKML